MSICLVGVGSRSIRRFCRNRGWFSSSTSPCRWRPKLSAQFANPRSRMKLVARPRNVPTMGIRLRIGLGSCRLAVVNQIREHQDAVDKH